MEKIDKTPTFDFEEIYISYFSRMKMFAMEYIQSEEDAENIVQDVFMALWEKRKVLPYETNILSYLIVSTKNRCLNHLRHEKLVQEVTSKLTEELTIEMELKQMSLENLNDALFSEPNLEAIITDAIQALPEKCREIFIKNKLEGIKQKDIAEEMHLSIKTIESQMAIAYKKIKEKLKYYFPFFLFLINH